MKTNNKSKKIIKVAMNLIVIVAFVLQSAAPIISLAADEPTAPVPPTAPSEPTAPEPPPDQGTVQTTDTGADSNNDASANTDNSTDVSSSNNSEILNSAFLNADSGKNNSRYNTGSGLITTQDASGNGELINIINRNVLNAQPAQSSAGQAGNESTGAVSDNSSQVNINNTLTIKNVNDSNTKNLLQANVVSGENDAGYNTGHGIISTGKSNLGLNFVTIANTNLNGSSGFYANWQNIFGDNTGNIDLRNMGSYNSSPLSDVLLRAANESTGAGSDNQAFVDSNSNTTIINQNTGKINNEINADVVSGKNKANYNVGTGSVTSGGVNSAINVLNFLNSNIISSNFILKNMNVFGNWNGSILLPVLDGANLTLSSSSTEAGNANTGADSNNDASANTDTSTNINNQNQAVITNNVLMKTDTGSNQASYNTGSGISNEGKAKAETNALNVANLNITGSKWWMVVVNKFGTWSGSAVGLPAGAEAQSSPDTTIFFPQNSGIKASNKSTGQESNNSAGANITDTTNIENLNNANILNTIKVNAISGQNEAQYNNGSGEIKTGDIKSAVNLVNFANANITVGDWTVVVINVFGDWDGNLVFNGNAFDTTLSLIGLSSISADSDSQLTAVAVQTGTGFNSLPYWFEETGGQPGAVSSTAWQSSPSFINSGLAPNTQYSYRVKTRDMWDNESSYSQPLSKFTLTRPPSNFLAAFLQTQKTSLSVDAFLNDKIGLSGYYFYRTDNETEHNSGWTQDNAWQDQNLTCGINYTYGIKYRNGDAVETLPLSKTILADCPAATVVQPPAPVPSGSSGGGGGGGGGEAYFAPVIAKKYRADINGDGKVDYYDLSILLANWGKKMKKKIADINSDNKVDSLDFSILISDWAKYKLNLAIAK